MEKKIIMSIFSFAIFFLVTFSFFYFKNNADIKQKENVSKDIVEKNKKIFSRVSVTDFGDVDCKEGWKKYVQNTIGISFCYPEHWGDPYTEPSRNITKLDGIVDQYGEDNGNFNAVHIRFPKSGGYFFNDTLVLKIFNDKYPGQHYPNAGTYHLGYEDNIPLLKKTENICDYEVKFNKKWERMDKKNEIYENCSGNVKEFIVETEEYFSRPKYSYELRLAAYRELTNKYFDHVLIEYYADKISQIDTKICGFEDFFENDSLDITRDDYEKTREEFIIFVNSIRSFVPIKKETQDCGVIDDKDENISIIKKYYCHLTNKEIEKAFLMRSGNSTSYDEFNGWYGNVNIASPRDYTKKQDGSYEFYVEYQDYNEEIETYRIIMSVRNGKVDTIFSEKYLSDVAKSINGHIAYGTRRGNKNMMILNIEGKEAVLDEGAAEYNEDYSNIGSVKYFFRPEFSESGRYLMYGMSGWEWSEARIFDLKKMEQIFKFDSPNNIGFLQNDKYLYACSSAGLASGVDGKVYTLPDLELLFDLTGDRQNIDFSNVECEYDEDENNVIFKESNFYDSQQGYVDDEKTIEKVFHLE